jgi:hypothetical protein
MKLVAIRDFANVRALGLTVDPKSSGFKHTNHVHKGYRFEIGKGDIFNDLPTPDRTVISQLIVSKAALIDNDANKPLIAKVDAEVKAQAAADVAADAKVQAAAVKK